MPEQFTLEYLEEQKKELENRLKILENTKLDELSGNDSDNSTDEDEDTMDALKEEIYKLNENIRDVEGESESEEGSEHLSSESEEDDISKKINSIIDKRKQLSVFVKDIDNLIGAVEIYINTLIDELEKKKVITKNDSSNLAKEYNSIMDEFDIEYNNIVGDMPRELNLTKTYIKNIDKRLSLLENDVNQYI